MMSTMPQTLKNRIPEEDDGVDTCCDIADFPGMLPVHFFVLKSLGQLSNGTIKHLGNHTSLEDYK